MKAIFKNNYTWESDGKCPEGLTGCAPKNINYKKGDIFSGITVSLSNDKKQVISNMGNYTIQIPVENFTILNNEDLKSNSVLKYKVNKTTNILKKNPNKKDPFGDVGTDVVGTLQSGDIIEIAKLGGGGRGIVMTPYLIFSDDTFILGYDADKVDNSTPLTPKSTLLTRYNAQGFLQKHKNHLLIFGVLAVGYLAYKKFKK